jgi:predicted DNA binding CopG/RHH family protein
VTVLRHGRDEVLGVAFSDHDLVVFLLRSMTSTKKQALLRLQPDVPAAGKAAAAARGLDFNKYVECLISEDTTGAARPA